MSSAAVQTAVTLHPDLGLPGQEYDSGPKTVAPYIATEVIAFGKYVIIDGNDCALGATATDITGELGGVALRDPTNPNGYYAIGDAVAVMTAGRAWVPTEEAVAFGQPVFVRFAGATGAEATGYFRNDSDGVTAAANAANPPGAVWIKGGTSVAVVQLGTAGYVGGVTLPSS